MTGVELVTGVEVLIIEGDIIEVDVTTADWTEDDLEVAIDLDDKEEDTDDDDDDDDAI